MNFPTLAIERGRPLIWLIDTSITNVLRSRKVSLRTEHKFYKWVTMAWVRCFVEAARLAVLGRQVRRASEARPPPLVHVYLASRRQSNFEHAWGQTHFCGKSRTFTYDIVICDKYKWNCMCGFRKRLLDAAGGNFCKLFSLVRSASEKLAYKEFYRETKRP